MRTLALLLVALSSALLGCPAEPEPEPHPCSLPFAGSVTDEGVPAGGELPGCGAFLLDWFDVRGEGDFALTLRWEGGTLVPIVTADADSVFEGLVLRGGVELAGEAPLRLWRHGYQSWSFAGVTELEPIETDARGLPEVGGDGDTDSFLGDTPFTSWWMGLLGRAGGASLMIGALDAETTKFHLAADTEALWLIWGTRGERIPMASGQELRLDPVHVAFGADPFALHRAYGEAVTERRPPPPLTQAPATGWSTWYVFYEDVVEEDVRRNLAFLEARRDAGEGSVDLIQVDDGWQRLWGDWQADAGFPSGMEGLAADITAAGFRPGLWMAPLYVHREAPAYLEHADWWVRDRDGQELSFHNLGTGDYAVLDVTHPDAAAWLAEQIAAKVEEGWPYLKLDFLYAGAEEGLRREDVTGMQAYRRAMEVMTEAAGPGVELLASGAPVLPSVGWFHAFRSGADIAFGNDPDPKREYLRWQTRSTAARSWMNGLWWWNDADAILLRAPYDAEEAWGAAVANAVSGGAWLLGDDLPALEADGRLDDALLPGLLDTLGLVGEPVDPLGWASGFETSPVLEPATRDDRVPLRWRLGDCFEAWLNLGDEAVDVELPEGVDVRTGETTGGPVRLRAGHGRLLVVN